MDSMTKQKWTRIIASLLIVACVAGIWIFKNQADPESPSDTGTSNPDFELVATSLDLEEWKSYGLPIVIDFGSEGCAPCREMYPTLKKLNADLQGKVIIKFVDVWEYPESGEGYPLTLIPSQVFYDEEGEQYLFHEGALTEEEFYTVFSEMGLEL